MDKPTAENIKNQVDEIRKAGKYKQFPVISGPMGPTITLDDGAEAVNLCSNNYLGLANHPEVIAGAAEAVKRHGNGTSSVRFICGTFSIHLELEEAIAEFLGAEKATTYVSCWNANEALLPTLLGEGDAVISDGLNHASIIDACRLCSKKVARYIYSHSNRDDLERRLKEASGARRKLIITDGVFSMDGDVADLPMLVELGAKYGAMVAIDDSHAHGVVGKTGRGVPEHFGVKADIITGTLGKALGGAAGGFIAGPADVVDLMVQNSRPQLFSNALPPATAGGALAAIKLLKREPQLVQKLRDNTAYMRKGLEAMGYKVPESPTAILPIIIGDAPAAMKMAKAMLSRGVLITALGFPVVVPKGTARLRAQISAAHKREHLDKALDALDKVRKET